MGYALLEREDNGIERLVATDGRRVHIIESQDELFLDSRQMPPGLYKMTMTAKAIILNKLKDECQFPNYKRAIPVFTDESKGFTLDMVKSRKEAKAVHMTRILFDLYSRGLKINMQYVDTLLEYDWLCQYNEPNTAIQFSDKPRAVTSADIKRIAVIMPMSTNK
jgi:hypothetical protein